MIFASKQERAVSMLLRPPSLHFKRVSAAAVLLAALLASAQQPVQPAAPQTTAGGSANLDAANAARKKQIADDSARLLQLATDLKTEVDKSDKDTLSIAVIRKAGEIEKLARSARESMKVTPGGN